MQTLFTAETAALRLTWSGPPRPDSGDGRPAPLVVRALGSGAVRLDRAGAVGRAERPVAFAEETSYSVLVQSLTGEPVALEHRDPVVVAGLATGDGGRVVWGRIRFGSQAGRTRFVARVGGRPEVEVEATVVPTKLTLSDVEAMRGEVEAAAAGLAVSSLRPTTLEGGGAETAAAPPVWLAALGASVGALEAAAAEIDRRPVLETDRPARAVRADRVRRPSAETRAAARRGGVADVLPGRPARLTDDTAAHRWLAGRLDRLLAHLDALAAGEERRRPSARRDAVRREVDGLRDRVRHIRARPVWGGAGHRRAARSRPPAVPPLALRRRPAYAAAYDALRAVDRGLDLGAGGLDVATQDLAVLYETWAALAVVRAAADALGAAPPPPLRVDVEGADVRLRSKQRVLIQGGAASVEVAVQPRFPAPPALLVQRPDLWLVVRRAGRAPVRVVLDAKYRRDDSAGYRRRHGAAGPPEDALGTLHRYRDAISGPQTGGAAVDLAAALFPGDDGPAFRASRLWTSLDALGVGAVPLRPGQEGALGSLLAGLLDGRRGGAV